MKLVDVRLSFPRAWNDPNDGDNIDADIYIYILHYDVKIARFSLQKILEFIK